MTQKNKLHEETKQAIKQALKDFSFTENLSGYTATAGMIGFPAAVA